MNNKFEFTLKAKENIDPEIAGLLGETKDIRQRYANTLLKLSKLAGNFEFNKSIRESAEQAGITVPTQNQILRNKGLEVAKIGQGGKYTQRVSDLVSDPEIEGLARPLQDVWTTQEFKDIIERDKGGYIVGDSDGRKKLMATKEFMYIYLYVYF